MEQNRQLCSLFIREFPFPDAITSLFNTILEMVSRFRGQTAEAAVAGVSLALAGVLGIAAKGDQEGGCSLHFPGLVSKSKSKCLPMKQLSQCKWEKTLFQGSGQLCVWGGRSEIIFWTNKALQRIIPVEDGRDIHLLKGIFTSSIRHLALLLLWSRVAAIVSY